MRTRSKTALAALAVLFGRPADSDRKAQIALGLEGIAERSIDMFLFICSQREALEDKGRTIVRGLN